MIEKILRHKDAEKFEGKYVKSIVYGGLDGIITTFAVVSGVTGASLASNVILILGSANLIADGISMAAGEYLSERAEQEYKHTNYVTKSPATSAVVTFLSFTFFGLIPLSIYILGKFLDVYNTFFLSGVLTVCTLAVLGIVRGKITKRNTGRAVVETVAIGTIAAAAAYGVGALVALLV